MLPVACLTEYLLLTLNVSLRESVCLAECARRGGSQLERGRDLVKFPRLCSGIVAAAEDGSTPPTKQVPGRGNSSRRNGVCRWSLEKLRHGFDREAVDHSPSPQAPQGRGPG